MKKSVMSLLHPARTTKSYEFTGFGAMDVTKPYEFIGFGAMDVTKPYEFTGYLKALWP